MRKTTLKIGSIALTLALSLSCIAGLAGCGEQEEDKKPTPTPEHHHTFEDAWTNDGTNHWHKATCEHTTEVSGKEAHRFTDGTCTVCSYADPNYVPPAPPAPEVLVSHYFETEDPHLDANAGELVGYGNTAIIARYEIEETDVGAPTAYNFALDAEKAGKGKILMRILTRSAENKLAENGLEMMFNDEPVTLTAVVPDSTGVPEEDYGFVWVELAEVELAKGANYIDFFATNNKAMFAIDKIDVQAAGDVTWLDDGNHYCSNWCASCRGCLDMGCEEESCSQKGASAGSILKKTKDGKCIAAGSSSHLKTFEAESEYAVRSTGMQTVAEEGENAGYAVLTKGSSVTFKLTQSKNQRFGLRITVGKLAKAVKVFDALTITFDGKDIKEFNCHNNTVIGALGEGETAGSAFVQLNFGCEWRLEGEHTIVITSLSDENLYLDSLGCFYRSALVWTDAPAE